MTTKSDKTPSKLTPEEEAVKILQEAQEKKMRACEEELVQVLQKHGFALDVQYQISLKPLPPQQK